MTKYIPHTSFYTGNSFIGYYASTNNKHTLVPLDSPASFIHSVRSNLKTEVVKTAVFGSDLIGLYLLLNDSVALVPEGIKPELRNLLSSELGLSILDIPTSWNANRNNLALNNKIALFNPNLPKKIISNLKDMGLEPIPFSLEGYSSIGSLVLLNDRGLAVGYLAKDSELDQLEELTGLPVSRATLNTGAYFLGPSALVNDNGFLAGGDSTAYEVGRIQEALGFL